MRLRTENLTVSYGAQTVLDGLSLALPAGKITALLGPNGCGKSTLLNCFSRLLTPDSGEILLDEKPIAGFSARQLARRPGFTAATPFIPRGDHCTGTGFLRTQPVAVVVGATLRGRQRAGQRGNESDPDAQSG